MKSVILVLFSCFLSYCLFAQMERSKWYFGNNAGLDFSSGTPVPLTVSQMQTNEGCSSIANQFGDLLFYTNGEKAWNSNHAVMPNGNGLLGHTSSSQSALIVPKPGSSEIYYIFTVAAQADASGLCFSEVDMSLQGGLGDITSNKNILLATPVCEKITAVKHTNGEDIWVITHESGTDKFLAYLVTANGINSSPNVSITGPVINGNSSIETIGCMKSDPFGKHIAMANYGSRQTVLFDFDVSNGIVSNPTILTIQEPNRPYGIEFSPCGNFLYVSLWGTINGGILQFNLSAQNLQLSAITIANNLIQAGTLQLAPDGKIYLSETGLGSDKLSVINSPELPGAGCDFVHNAITLNYGIVTSGLPNFVVTSSTCLDPPITPDSPVTDCSVQLPNIFTPNNDLANDFFTPVSNTCASITKTTIVNRWGEVVYYVESSSPSWPGTDQSGRELTEGTYFWTIEYVNNSETENQHGFVMLMRD